MRSIEMLLEEIDVLAPETSIRREPVIDFSKGARAEPIPAALGVNPDIDQPGVAQYFEMF